MRTGILGGTFNPPHLGHLQAAKNAYESLGLDEVQFIPTGIPPHKALPEGSATTRQRCDMLSLMLADTPWAKLNTIETERAGKSYTVDTLRALHAQGAGELFLIIGTDMLLSFDTIWKAPDEISRLATLAVCARAHAQQETLCAKSKELQEKFGTQVVVLQGTVFPASSTEIRNGEQLEALTAPAVLAYIKENQLYQL